jgi:hypothetical protein
MYTAPNRVVHAAARCSVIYNRCMQRYEYNIESFGHGAASGSDTYNRCIQRYVCSTESFGMQPQGGSDQLTWSKALLLLKDAEVGNRSRSVEPAGHHCHHLYAPTSSHASRTIQHSRFYRLHPRQTSQTSHQRVVMWSSKSSPSHTNTPAPTSSPRRSGPPPPLPTARPPSAGAASAWPAPTPLG